jgi:membrane protease YdiL (CAAX protease family)
MNRLFTYRPTLLQAWGLVALTILAQLVSGQVLAPLIPPAGATQSWHLLLSYVLSFVLMIFVVIRLGKTVNGQRSTVNGEWQTDVSPAGGGAGTAGVDGLQTANGKLPLPTLLLLLFFMPALAVTIEPLYVWLPMPEWIKELFEAAFKNDAPTFLSAVVAAPLAEEWLCRGVILRGLLTHCSPRKAIVWSAILFGVLHMNPWQAIPAFCMGLAIGWVYRLTRSLWPCIFMHAVNNGLAFLMLQLFPDAASDATTIDVAGHYYIWIYVTAAVCSVFTGYGIWRLLQKNHYISDR